MSKEAREVVADWLLVVAALGLFVSLFFAWSHQFSHAFLVEFGSSPLLRGVPHDPTAWQVYSAADVLLALLAVGVFAVALVGTARARFGALIATGVGLAFTLHALGTPPTNGADIFNPSSSVPNYFPVSATAGPGETVAIAALIVVIVGLLLSFSAD